MICGRKYFHNYVHSLFIHQLVTACWPLFPILRYMAVNKIGKVPDLRKLTLRCRREANKQY